MQRNNKTEVKLSLHIANIVKQSFFITLFFYVISKEKILFFCSGIFFMVNNSRRKFLKNLFGFGATAALGGVSVGIMKQEKKLTEQEAQRLMHKKQATRLQRINAQKIATAKARNEKEFELMQKEYLDTVDVAPEITLRIMQSSNPRKLIDWLRVNGKSYRKLYAANPLTKKQVARNKRILSKEIEKFCKEFDFPQDVAKKLVQKESGWNPLAVSPAGESFGLMQMHVSLIGSPYTNRYFHNPFDPLESIHAGVKHLSDLYIHFNGDMEKTLTAYNIRGGSKTIDVAVKAMGSNWRDFKQSISTNKYYGAVLSQKIE